MSTLELHEEHLETPVGKASLVCDGAGAVRALDWLDHGERQKRLLDRHYGRDGYRLRPAPVASTASRAVMAYFEGELDALDQIVVATAGTPFQRQVWQALRAIAPGRTASYAELARVIGRAPAVRAVGLANGANPIAILVPCHRVIGRNGSLTGYAGGLERKRWLLQHEGCVA